MARRSTPDRLYAAKRAGTVERLATGGGFGRSDAEGWIAAWERDAEARGLLRTDPAYWPAGETWIAMRRAQDRKPPTAD
jgi:hypothetical protein